MSDRTAPFVSVITRAYNVEKYIAQCADSVLGQSFQDFEWLVLENGSTDGTGAILKGYAQKDSRIRLFINEKNYNVLAPSEEGCLRYVELLKAAKGKYIADLDSDDFLHTDFLKTLVEAADGEDVDIVAAGSAQFQDDNPCGDFKIVTPKAFRGEDITEMGNNIDDFYDAFRPTWGKLILREFYAGNMEYILNRPSCVVNGGDTFCCLRMLQIAKKCICIDKPLYYFRSRQNSTSKSNFYKERYLSYDAIFYEGERLLKIWNKNTEENYARLCRIHLGGMEINLNMLSNAKDILLENRLDFIEGMLNSEVYNGYRSGLPKEQSFWLESYIDLVLEKICCVEGRGKEACFYKYNFSRRFIAKRLMQNRQSNDYDMMLYVASAASVRNKITYENKLLELCMKYISGKACASLHEVRSVLCKYTQTAEREMQKKMQVSALLEEERYPEAMEVLQTFDDSMKMDCDVLYAKACCHNAAGDLKNTLTLLAVANELYPDEEVIRESLDDISGAGSKTGEELFEVVTGND